MEQARIAGSQGGSGTQGAQPARGKPQSPSAGSAADPAAQGGFLALLTALDDASQGTLPAADLSTGMAAGSDPQNTPAFAQNPDPATLAAWQGWLLQGAAAGAGVSMGAAGSAVAGQAAADGAVGMPGLAGVAGAVGSAQQPLFAGQVVQTVGANGLAAASTLAGQAPGIPGLPVADGLPVSEGLVAQTALLDSAAEAAGPQPKPGAAALHNRAASRLHNALSKSAESLVAGVASVANRPGMDNTQALAAAASAAPPAQAVVEPRDAGGHLAQAAVHGGREPLAGLGNASLTPVQEAFMESRAASHGAGAGGGDAGGQPSGDAAAWGDWGLLQPSPGAEVASVDGAAVFADPAQRTAEEYIADQVTYWVSQQTQNAEMTLDRDGQPVQVTVSLSGGEAHVTFRSDQAQTRELLDSSLSQLRDLLQNEGLVLAGATVETSARDGASAQSGDSGPRQGREGGRRAQVVASVPSSVAPAQRGSGANHRAVDLFV